ncbi:signal peptidase I [Deinococcus aetherius]|uniref:Signal peptidase I n=2 Tax=Deinococcus aetherius TaxID=200252 RepID=A0ABM8AAG3_9DEIO|nr:signal peptidase I [Deinococcus aetherius]
MTPVLCPREPAATMPRVTPVPSRRPLAGTIPAELRTFWRVWVLGALLPVWLFTTFVATLARVDGNSMNPTLHNRDLLVLLKYPRWLRAWGLPTPYPRRGDLLIFKSPADSPYSYETVWGVRHRPYNIKRVLGLPGDTVAITDGRVIVNGRAIAESYVNGGVLTDQPPLRVPPGKVWVLGDNRLVGESLDSRAYGPVDLGDAAGPVNLRLWPNPGLVHR